MQIDVRTTGIKKLERSLNLIQRKQLPFATSKALNQTAAQIVKAEQKQAERLLDRPKPATIKGIRYKASNKRNLVATVFVIPAVAKYLWYQIEGGIRNVTTVVPNRGYGLNKYGNVPARRNKGWAKKRKQFWIDDNGKTLLVRPMARKNKLVGVMKKNPSYKPRYPWYKIAHGVANSQFPKNMARALRDALRTAR